MLYEVITACPKSSDSSNSAGIAAQLTAMNGAVDQSNFDSYEVCRVTDAPDVQVAIFENEP